MRTLKKGFTLIELLVVIAIIAILATIVILNVSSARTKAQDVKVQEAVTEMAKAIETANVDSGTIPTTTVKAIGSASGEYDMTGILDSSGTKLIASNPVHPISGKTYKAIIGSGTSYTISGEINEKSGTNTQYYQCTNGAVCTKTTTAI